MAFYVWSTGFTAILSFLLGLVVYFHNKSASLNKKWMQLSISISLWCFGYFLTLTGHFTHDVSLIFSRLSHASGAFIPILFFDFVIILLNIRGKYSSLLKKGYLFSIIMFFACFSPLVVKDIILKLNIKYYPESGLLYPFYALSYYIFATYGNILLFTAMKRAVGDRKNQLRYFFVGTALGFAGGVSLFFLIMGIRIPPFASVLIGLYPVVTSYAIVRHQLMDIEVLIKKTLVFTSLFTIVFGIFVGIALLIQQFIGVGGNLLRFAISSLVIIFTVRPLEILLVRITDKYLFQKKYDYKHLINEFMDELKTMVLNTNDIAQSTVDFINTSIRPVSSAIFMHNIFTSRYDLVASSDFKDEAFNIPDNSNIVKILTETGKILNVKKDSKLILIQGKKQFAELGIEVMIPLLIHKELIGILCLGKKRSDEDYAEDDIEALSGLSGALSISLNNAQLFDERADAEKRALVGTIATGINHEIGNPLNIITIKLDTFRILAKEGLLEKKSKEQIIEDVNEIAKVCLESAQRIAEITKQVSEFAKPDKKLVFDKVNINEAIDETIAFLKNGMILDIGKIEKQIICEPVYAMADRGQLKQILFNLVKNASHAIDKEKGKIIIDVDNNGSSEVIIKISDNGHGMPKEVMEKVFTPFFTTKEPGKGTGLGLALVKIMIDRNGGKIKVESQEGKGTAFTLVFKGGLL